MAAKPLRLSEALTEADQRAFPNRQARATADADRARAALPLKGILPSARLEGGFVRTTDPIGAFGTTLRQRQVSPAAFDPMRLNYPAPLNNVVAGAVIDVPILNADALGGWRAARAAASATGALATWTTTAIRVNVIQAYYGAVLAGNKVTTLEAAERAATAGVRQVDHLVAQGLVTKADALLIAVRISDIRAQLLAARHEALTARQRLALLLGRTDAMGMVLPDALPTDSTVRAIAVQMPAGPVDAADVERATNAREDVRAARLGLAAARADAQRAFATMVPRVNGFARYDWNSPTTLYAGRPNWTVGVMASWSLFGAGTELADAAGAAARTRSARAGIDGATASAHLDIESTARAIGVAIGQLELAERAAAQSREAHRLVEKRYLGGLATITELLAAEATATGAALGHSAARFHVIAALAQHRHAIGADPGALTILEFDAAQAAGVRQ